MTELIYIRISMGGIVSNIASKFNTQSQLDDVKPFRK